MKDRTYWVSKLKDFQENLAEGYIKRAAEVLDTDILVYHKFLRGERVSDSTYQKLIIYLGGDDNDTKTTNLH